MSHDQTFETGADDTARAAQLRAGLVDYLRERGAIVNPGIERAFATVPRHLFLPGVELETAYQPQVVVTKRADDGSAVSSASHPNMVASMLEQLAVQPGQRVLEIGTATGINAALLAELVGPTGYVVTIEIDADLTDIARTSLTAAGYGHVEVVCADGALGHPNGAPFDRIIATVGAFDVPTGWWNQLAVGGRLVVPLRLHGSDLTRSIAFDHHVPGRLDSVSARVCGFVPMRGISDAAVPSIPLADDIALRVDAADTTDPAGLGQALTYPAHEAWAGIPVSDQRPVEHLDLWLASTAPHFGRLSVGPTSRNKGAVRPAPRWAGAALHDGAGTLAYLAVRPTADHADELGVIAHGPDAHALTKRTIALLHRWDSQGPGQPTITARPSHTAGSGPSALAEITRPDTTLTITW